MGFICPIFYTNSSYNVTLRERISYLRIFMYHTVTRVFSKLFKKAIINLELDNITQTNNSYKDK